MQNKKPLKILCIILARSGSKTVKNKNIAKINGKPLIWYTIKEALKSNVFDEILVSTDSKKYRKIAIKLGAKVPFLRPKKLSTGKTKAVDCLKFTLKKFEKITNKKYPYIVD